MTLRTRLNPWSIGQLIVVLFYFGGFPEILVNVYTAVLIGLYEFFSQQCFMYFIPVARLKWKSILAVNDSMPRQSLFLRTWMEDPRLKGWREAGSLGDYPAESLSKNQIQTVSRWASIDLRFSIHRELFFSRLSFEFRPPKLTSRSTEIWRMTF